MSRTACQIAGYHEWKVITDSDNWWPVAVVCTDWECGVRVPIGDGEDDDE